MPKKRPPREVWQQMREETWKEDKGKCRHCGEPVSLEECHCDHIKSGKLGTNDKTNRRTLCRRCHVLRDDKRHRGMISKALKDGLIPPNWRELVWSD